MEDIKALIKEGKFIRVDAEGTHIEGLEEFTQLSIENVLTKLNRYPDDLIRLYEKTQNQKFLNDIGLACIARYYHDKYEKMLSNYKEDNDTSSTLLNDLNTQLDNVKKELQKVIEDKDLALTQLAEAENERDESDSLYDKIRNEFDNKQQELDKVNASLLLINEKYEDASKTVITYSNEIDKLKETNTNLVSINNHLKEQYEKIVNESKEKDKEIAALKDNLNNGTRLLKKELDTYKEIIATVEESLAKVKRQNTEHVQVSKRIGDEYISNNPVMTI